MSKKAGHSSLTETELELMNALWRLEKGTVRDVLTLIAPMRAMAYTSASTIIRILEQKGFVESSKEGKAHVYSPKIPKSEYEKSTLNQVIKNVFSDTPADLVRRLVDDAPLSKKERMEIRKIIEDKL